jgi:hypothetical protein
MLIGLPDSHKILLRAMYNAMLRHRYIPRKWKLIVQSMLYKAGDEMDLNNYRAISLGKTMLKLLDKIVE